MSYFDDSDIKEGYEGCLQIQQKFLKWQNQSQGKTDKRLVINLLPQIYLWAYFLIAKIKDTTNNKNF